MASDLETIRALVQAAHELLVQADARLDALASAPDPIVRQAASEADGEADPEPCQHPKTKREDISGFGERNGARYRCGVCRQEVAA